jgi:ferrous iron transport protein B
VSTATRPARPAPCCEPTLPGADAAVDTARFAARIALVGNPNVGKSTVFNLLTGARQHVGNWPGKTVHVATGTWRLDGRDIEVVDLPGTYSLVPASPDEQLTRDLLVDRGLAGRPDLAVVVVDAANLARNLYLVAQVSDTGVPMVVALTMTDVATGRGIHVDPTALAETVGAPVVPISPRRGRGRADLAAAVAAALDAHAAPAGPRPAAGYPLGAAADAVLADAVRLVAGSADLDGRVAPRWLALALLSGEDLPEGLDGLSARARAGIPALRERLTATDGGSDDGVDADDDIDSDMVLAERRYAWVHEVAGACVRRSGPRTTWSDRADRVLTSRLFGLPAFLLTMWGVFVATTRLAAPLQDGLAALLDGPVRGGVTALLGWLHVAPGSWLAGLVLDGLVSGVGQVLTFAPLMVIMFVLLALLEDSGYMARAAFVVDRFMRLVGLPGRAFLPLIVGFGCNVPAVSGVRILAHPRQRLLTGLLVPYASCSARLTVYLLLAHVFFGSAAGTVVFGMYLLSIALIVLVGLALRRTLFAGHEREPLILELPPYRRPTLRVVGTQTWQRLAGFLRTAAGIIVVTVTAVWLLASVPLSGGRWGAVPIEDSLYAGVARTVAPVFAPAGFADWHASSALMTGFVAKEVVVANLGQTYAAQGGSADLAPRLTATFTAASHGHPRAAVLAFLVFLLAYTPCMATVAAQRQEIGTRWTLAGIGLQLAVAWLLAVAVFQIGALL